MGAMIDTGMTISAVLYWFAAYGAWRSALAHRCENASTARAAVDEDAYCGSVARPLQQQHPAARR